jgi:hypothetical protein
MKPKPPRRGAKQVQAPALPNLTEFSQWAGGEAADVDCQIRLYNNQVDFSQPYDLTYFFEATFNGYRRVQSEHFTIRRAAGGYLAYAATGICTYVCQAGGQPQVIYGWYAALVDNSQGGAPEKLLYASAFDLPGIRMQGQGDIFSRIYSLNSVYASVPRPSFYPVPASDEPRVAMDGYTINIHDAALFPTEQKVFDEKKKG